MVGRSSGSRSLRVAVGALPLVVAISVAGVAGASPAVQPGVTTPSQPGTKPSQPGITTSPAVPVISTAPVGATPLPDEVAPATDYAPIRQVPAQAYVAPLRPERLHAPAPMPQVAPIAPPQPSMLRVGDITAPRPDFLPKEQTDQINAAAAGYEAQISTTARSVGIAPSRADRVASSAVADAASGLVTGCLVGGVLAGVAFAPFGLIILTPVTATLGAAYGCAVMGGIGAGVGLLAGAGAGGLQ